MNSPEGLLQFWKDFDMKTPALKEDQKENDHNSLPLLDDDTEYEFYLEGQDRARFDPWSEVTWEICQRCSIEDLLDELGAVKTGEGSYLCPFHQETNASFHVYRTGDADQVWICFHGDAPVGFQSANGYFMGDVIDMYQYLHDLPSPGAATVAMAKELGIDPGVPEPGVPEYEHTPEGTVYHKPKKDGTTRVRLSNFNATIVEEVIIDDGAEERRTWWLRLDL